MAILLNYNRQVTLANDILYNQYTVTGAPGPDSSVVNLPAWMSWLEDCYIERHERYPVNAPGTPRAPSSPSLAGRQG